MRILPFLLLLAAVPCLGTEAASYDLGPCRVTVAVPDPHVGRAVVIAHGSRPAHAPLTADLDLDDGVVRSLLKQGWIVAATSYRRNGDIFHDAVADVADLLDHLHERHGVTGVLVEGWSLGAGVATALAESGHPHLDGVLGIGALYSHPVGDETIVFSGHPRVPVLLMNNRSEATDALAYGGAPVWVVDRDGHCNVNVRERGEALRALHLWVDGGEAPKPRDAFLVTMTPESTARPVSDGLSVAVRRVDPAFGNVVLELTAGDLAVLGLTDGDTLSVRAGETVVTALLGTTYADVAPGEWIAFLDAEGWTVLARNMASAAEVLECSVGDRLVATRPR